MSTKKLRFNKNNNQNKRYLPYEPYPLLGTYVETHIGYLFQFDHLNRPQFVGPFHVVVADCRGRVDLVPIILTLFGNLNGAPHQHVLCPQSRLSLTTLGWQLTTIDKEPFAPRLLLQKVSAGDTNYEARVRHLKLA